MLFNIIPSYIEGYSENIRACAIALSRLKDEVESSIRVLGNMRGMEDLVEVLRQNKAEIADESVILRNINYSLNEISGCYEWSENNVINEVDDSYVRYRTMRVSLQRTPVVSTRAEELMSTISIV